MIERTPSPSRLARSIFTSPAPVPRPYSNSREAVEPLCEKGAAFLVQMAGRASLSHAAERCPDVVNQLAPLSYSPDEMIAKIGALLAEELGDQNIPMDVRAELIALRQLYRSYRGL